MPRPCLVATQNPFPAICATGSEQTDDGTLCLAAKRWEMMEQTTLSRVVHVVDSAKRQFPRLSRREAMCKAFRIGWRSEQGISSPGPGSSPRHRQAIERHLIPKRGVLRKMEALAEEDWLSAIRSWTRISAKAASPNIQLTTAQSESRGAWLGTPHRCERLVRLPHKPARQRLNLTEGDGKVGRMQCVIPLGHRAVFHSRVKSVSGQTPTSIKGSLRSIH
ncbi:hypothetical protein QBC47DRAFT_18105 [Echria macrotheca]|uniref:Uncharacterized protein n=1 Tax=Echria macrotheca TaxID=438768 RepID=A0AAJ0FGE9_9PEZI|nr:hypothetical protein QBC47DRAFT_18105 [Echria macrotheca]